MPEIPFPQGITGLESFPKQQEWLVNLFVLPDGVVRMPGINSFATGAGICRGAQTWRDGLAYMVSGTSLIRISSAGVVTTLGTISGTADCIFSPGQTDLVIIVKGGNGYRYNDTDGLVQITDTDYLPSVGVDFIDGRHVFVPDDGDPAIYSEVDAPEDIDGLSFFDAEELPDKNRAVINVQNQLFLGGDDSFEIFRTNIDPDVVFTRREGARTDVGYISGLVRFDGSFAFIGRQRDQAPQIYVMGTGTAQPISTPPIIEILNTQYTADELRECDAFRYEWKGYEVLVFNLARHTLKFCNNLWTYADSNLNGSSEGPWRAKGICYAYGKYIVGDREDDSIGFLDDIETEYGEQLEAEVQTFIRGERDSYTDVTSIEIDALTGQTASNVTIGLSLSRDARTWGEYRYKSLGLTGAYNRRVVWQPVGNIENYLGIRLRVTGNVKFSLESIQST